MGEISKINMGGVDYNIRDKVLEEQLGNINAKPMISVTYAELVALRDNGELIAGMQYRITDFVTTTAQENTRSAGHQFDVIVTADNANTLNEVARACRSEFNIEKYKDAHSYTLDEKVQYMGTYKYNGEVYHYYESFSCNMLVSFNEAVEYDASRINPYIIIPSYIMLDGNNWEIGTDEGEDIAFKYNPTIASYFKDSNLAAWQLWYCLDNDTERFAWADAENGKGVIYRMIDEWNNDLPYDFKNIMFVRYELEAPEEYIAEGNDSLWMQQLCNNVRAMFDEGVRSFVWAGIADEDKYWEDDMSQILSHTTGENFAFFTFNTDEDTDASLSGGIHDNKMLFSQTLPNNVFFSSSCNSNSFGNDCYYNSFGNSSQSNELKAYYRYITFGEGVQYVTLLNETEGDYENQVQNFRVANGTHGEDGNPLVVDVTRNMGCETFIGMDSNDELKVFCLADLLNS